MQIRGRGRGGGGLLRLILQTFVQNVNLIEKSTWKIAYFSSSVIGVVVLFLLVFIF